MSTKRKSDAIELSSTDDAPAPGPLEGGSAANAKRARVDDASGSTAKAKPAKASDITRWQVQLEDKDEEGDVPVYDNCNEIRRKIRLLQKTEGFKIGAWLRDIGGINSNSFSRFTKASGPMGGAENGTFPAAYIYFEKLRIMEGKKKTKQRLQNEDDNPCGLKLRDSRRGMWVLGPAR